MMKADKIKSPIISRNKKDPTQSSKQLASTYRNIKSRYIKINKKIINIINLYLIGYEQTTNKDYLFKSGRLYKVNSGYVYDLSARQFADIAKKIQNIIDEYLLEGGELSLWVFSFIETQYRRGTHSAFINLSHQSNYYAEQTTLTALLSKPAYVNQIMMAFTLSFNNWKSLSETTKVDLSSVLANAIARGINPKDTAKVISDRLNVSFSKAKSLAQTEQLAAYRQSQWSEAQWASDRLGLKTSLLHQSALSPTTRLTHAYWHGKTRTPDEVREWYEESGNRFNCHCSQVPVLLDENGQTYNGASINKLRNDFKQWEREIRNE